MEGRDLESGDAAREQRRGGGGGGGATLTPSRASLAGEEASVGQLVQTASVLFCDSAHYDPAWPDLWLSVPLQPLERSPGVEGPVAAHGPSLRPPFKRGTLVSDHTT